MNLTRLLAALDTERPAPRTTVTVTLREDDTAALSDVLDELPVSPATVRLRCAVSLALREQSLADAVSA